MAGYHSAQYVAINLPKSNYDRVPVSIYVDNGIRDA